MPVKAEKFKSAPAERHPVNANSWQFLALA